MNCPYNRMPKKAGFTRSPAFFTFLSSLLFYKRTQNAVYLRRPVRPEIYNVSANTVPYRAHRLPMRQDDKSNTCFLCQHCGLETNGFQDRSQYRRTTPIHDRCRHDSLYRLQYSDLQLFWKTPFFGYVID